MILSVMVTEVSIGYRIIKTVEKAIIKFDTRYLKCFVLYGII